MFTALGHYSFITYNANVEKKLIMLKVKVPTLWYKEKQQEAYTANQLSLF